MPRSPQVFNLRGSKGKIEQYLPEQNAKRIAQIAGAVAGGGEPNTASNQGTDGVGVYDTKVVYDLQFRHVAPASSKITVVLNGKDIDIDIAVDQILHNSLGGLNAGDNYEHITATQKAALHTIYSLEVHNNTHHDPDYKPDFSENTGFNKNFGTLGTEVCVGNDSRLSDARTPLAHILGTSGPHTGTLPWGDLSKTGSNLTDLATRQHAGLTDVTSDQHHNESHALDSHTVPTSAIAMSSQKFTGMAAGTINGDSVRYEQLHAEQHAMDSVTYHTRTDITTLNASTSYHGFLKKLDNQAANFMNGQGNWSVPVGTYVDADAVSAVATADDYLKNDVSDTMVGTLTIEASAVPIKFFEVGTTNYIRRVLDGGTWRLDRCTDGDGQYTPYTTPISIAPNDVTTLASLIMNGNISMGSHNITLNASQTVDGVDISVFNTAMREQSSTFPGSPSEGDFHYDEDDDSLYRYNAEALAWVEVGVGGGRGSLNLINEIEDVVITSVVNNELLAYDSGSSKWINQTKAEVGLQYIFRGGKMWCNIAAQNEGESAVMLNAIDEQVRFSCKIPANVDTSKNVVLSIIYKETSGDPAITTREWQSAIASNNTEVQNWTNIQNEATKYLDYGVIANELDTHTFTYLASDISAGDTLFAIISIKETRTVHFYDTEWRFEIA